MDCLPVWCVLLEWYAVGVVCLVGVLLVEVLGRETGDCGAGLDV